MRSGSARLAHGWRLVRGPGVSTTLVGEFIRPAVRAVPPSLARRLGACRIELVTEAAGGAASGWTTAADGFEITVATAGSQPHDIALELLLCLGQRLRETLSDGEVRAWWAMLASEIEAGIQGEIDEQALAQKRPLLRNRARSARRFARYAHASFAGTAAEYIHCLWHDVTVRSGPDHLPAWVLRRRLELLNRWFPAGRGYRLFPVAPPAAG